MVLRKEFRSIMEEKKSKDIMDYLNDYLTNLVICNSLMKQWETFNTDREDSIMDVKFTLYNSYDVTKENLPLMEESIREFFELLPSLDAEEINKELIKYIKNAVYLAIRLITPSLFEDEEFYDHIKSKIHFYCSKDDSVLTVEEINKKYKKDIEQTNRTLEELVEKIRKESSYKEV